jgi:hypothetical protein
LPTVLNRVKENKNETGSWRPESINKSPQKYDILAKMLCYCTSVSEMKEKMKNTSNDVFASSVCLSPFAPFAAFFFNVFIHPLKSIEK